MKCSVCQMEFNEELFPHCPFCLSPVDSNADKIKNIEEKTEDKKGMFCNESGKSNKQLQPDFIVMGGGDIECDIANQRKSSRSVIIDYKKYMTSIEDIPNLNNRSIDVLRAYNICSVGDLLEYIQANDLYYELDKVSSSVIRGNIKNALEKFFDCSLVDVVSDLSYQIIDKSAIDKDERTRLTKISMIDGLSNRSKNILLKNNINTINDLIDFASVHDLKKDLGGVGEETQKNIMEVLNGFMGNDTDDSKSKIVHIPIDMNTDLDINVDNIAGDILKTEIKNVSEFTNRARNVLYRNNITRIIDLVMFLKEYDLQEKLRGVGKNTKANIIKVLKDIIKGKTLSQTDVSTDLGTKSQSFCIDNVPQDKLDIMLDTVYGFSSIAKKVFASNGIKTVRELIEFEEEYGSMCNLKKVGKSTQNNIEETLHNFLYEDHKIDIKSRLKLFLDDALYTREGLAALRHAKGETLQDIADSLDFKENKISRERVRQIEKKFYKKLIPYVQQLIDEVRNGENYFALNRLDEYFDNDDYNTVIRSTAIMLKDKYEYIDFADVCIIKDYYKSWKSNFKMVIDDYVGEYINLLDSFEEIQEKLNSYGVDFITIEGIKNYLQKHGYKVYRDIAYQKSGYARICAKLVKEHFKDGITLPNRGTENNNSDMIILREKLQSEYGINLDVDDGTMAVQIRNHLVMCGKSRYTAPENISIDESLLLNIKEYLDGLPETRFLDGMIFDKFAGRLKTESNVDNQFFLHGVLLYNYGGEYKGSNHYISKRLNDGKDENPIADLRENIIYEFIHRAQHPINKKELKKKYKHWSDIMINLTLQNSDKIIPWEFNEYYSMDLLDIDAKDIEVLNGIIVETMKPFNGYTNAYLVFKEVKKSFNQFLIKNDVIKNGRNLFYILEKLFNRVCEFRYPHIGLKEMFESLNSNSMLDILLNTPKEIIFSSFLHKCHEFGWPESQTRTVFTKYKMNFLQVSSDR